MSLPLPLSWTCADVTLTAMLHRPPHGTVRSAILMVPGGSDYRIGSHRSYVRLAQALAEAGHMVMRMDVSGMGDSGGLHAGFEALELDIASGLSLLRQHAPADAKIMLWGQCDGASAILISMGAGLAADGAILCNPWVRNAQTAAAQVVRHHYPRQLLRGQSWRRLLTGKTNIWHSVRHLWRSVWILNKGDASQSSYLDRISATLTTARFPCLIVIGENDAGGQEFRLYANKLNLPAGWVTQIPGGNHSFSTKTQRDILLRAAFDWLKKH